MPRSEVLCASRAQPAQAVGVGHGWLGCAGEVAQWTAQLLAWLWLGQQGAHLGWSWASGVLAVALWWSLRVLCRGAGWAFRSPSAVVGCFGFLTALGAWLTAQLGAGVGAHASLLALAAVWGVWSALIETRSQVSTFQPGRLPWPSVGAAVLLGLAAWGGRGLVETDLALGVCWVLALCAAVLCARDSSATGRARACSGVGHAPQSLLAPSAMGLMMGTLWLGHDWCLGAGWGTEPLVIIHVVLMVGLPALVAALFNAVWRAQPGRGYSLQGLECAGLALLTLGAWLGWGNGQLDGLLSMLLFSLAWAFHCHRERSALRFGGRMGPWTRRWLALACGPAMLVGVGVLSPVQGPLALKMALTGLGVLAAVCLLVRAWPATPVNFAVQASAGLPRN